MKIDVIPGENDAECTFVLNDETHTMGNSLRFVLSNHPDVAFCAYSIPHPSESKLHLRLQIQEASGKTAKEVLREGLVTLRSAFTHIKDTYEGSLPEES